jgi:hypothetical protein
MMFIKGFYIYNILLIIYRFKVGRATKNRHRRRTTTTAVTKPNKKENKQDSIVETGKEEEQQENAAGVEIEDLKEEK